METYYLINGQKLSVEEYQEQKRQEEAAKQRAREEAARLVRELGEAYKACSAFMEKNPELCMRVGDAEAREHELYEKLRRNLEKADEAPRCEKVREDGTKCASPQMKGYDYCYAHERMLQARARKLELPAQEDANSIQMAVMMVQRALIDDEISEKKAGLLLYSLQIAASNVKNTTFGKEEDIYLVTEMPREEIVGEKVVKGRMVWTTEYEEEEVSDQQEAVGQGGESVEEVRRRLPQMSADGEDLTAEAGRDGEGTQAGGRAPDIARDRKPNAGEGACGPRASLG